LGALEQVDGTYVSVFFERQRKDDSLRPNGIPTVYRDVQFRSRLEAKWAAFFDFLGWRWEYEPFDLAGWIPDFLLVDAGVLVEVKPVQDFPRDIANEIVSVLPQDKEALIVGCVFPVEHNWNGNSLSERMTVDSPVGMPVGWMLGRPMNWLPEEKPRWGLGLIQKFRTTHPPGFEDLPSPEHWGLFHSHDAWLRCDPGYSPCEEELPKFASSRMGYGDDLQYHGSAGLLGLWRLASNRTQWKGVQAETDAARPVKENRRSETRTERKARKESEMNAVVDAAWGDD
jgi:hypothetical protein